MSEITCWRSAKAQYARQLLKADQGSRTCQGWALPRPPQDEAQSRVHVDSCNCSWYIFDFVLFLHIEDMKQSRDLALPFMWVGTLRISWRRRSRDRCLCDGEKMRTAAKPGKMHATSTWCRFSQRTAETIVLRLNVEDSRSENGWYRLGPFL